MSMWTGKKLFSPIVNVVENEMRRQCVPQPESTDFFEDTTPSTVVCASVSPDTAALSVHVCQLQHGNEPCVLSRNLLSSPFRTPGIMANSEWRKLPSANNLLEASNNSLKLLMKCSCPQRCQVHYKCMKSVSLVRRLYAWETVRLGRDATCPHE